MRVAVFGVGAVGARVARQLASTDGVADVVVADAVAARAESVTASIGPGSSTVPPKPDAVIGRGCDAVVLAGPPGTHGVIARRFLAAGLHVVSTSGSVVDVKALLELDHEAAERRRSVVVGAGFTPGLSCVLARHLAGLFDVPTEVHVARTGHGGPACARQQHAALSGVSVEWRDGAWVERHAGSGRELVWFPDPIGGLDCYRAAAPDPLLLTRTLPGVERVTARMAATPFDRLTGRLRFRPRLRRPPADGGLGGVRVEVRGRRGAATQVEVYGAIDRPAVASGIVAAVACAWAIDGRLERFGAGGLGELTEPVPILVELARRGVKAAVFAGVGG